jgi:mediator of RNA polymerase II transcription subunit 16
MLMGYVATYGATVAGLTVTAAAAIKYAANFDDMLAVVRPYIGKKSKLSPDWICD